MKFAVNDFQAKPRFKILALYSLQEGESSQVCERVGECVSRRIASVSTSMDEPAGRYVRTHARMDV